MTDMTAVIVPKSDQINSDDLIAGPMTITITDVKVVGGQEQPVSISFTGSPKVYRPCKSMSRVLVAAWGPDANAYAGRSLTLYRDPGVKWGGMAVGGIRISHMSDIEREMTMMLTMTKQNRAPHKVKVLEKKASLPTAAPADEAVQTEARAEARKGTEAFRAWFKANPDKRSSTPAIMESLKATCAEADAALSDDTDPFGLPPIRPTEAELAAAMAEAEAAAREGGE